MANLIPVMARVADNHRDWPPDRKACQLCLSGQHETISHMVCDCSYFAAEREACKKEIDEIVETHGGLSSQLPEWELQAESFRFLRSIFDDRVAEAFDDDLRRRLANAALGFLKIINKKRSVRWSQLTLPASLGRSTLTFDVILSLCYPPVG